MGKGKNAIEEVKKHFSLVGATVSTWYRLTGSSHLDIFEESFACLLAMLSQNRRTSFNLVHYWFYTNATFKTLKSPSDTALVNANIAPTTSIEGLLDYDYRP